MSEIKEVDDHGCIKGLFPGSIPQDESILVLKPKKCIKYAQNQWKPPKIQGHLNCFYGYTSGDDGGRLRLHGYVTKI